MRHELLDVLTSADPALRDRALDDVLARRDVAELLRAAAVLDAFRRETDNLYHRVRALVVLADIHRVHLPARAGWPPLGPIARDGHAHWLARRFDDALEAFLRDARRHGANGATSSALAAAYRGLAFDTLQRQVRASVRGVDALRWMFAVTDPDAHPLRLVPELRGPPAHAADASHASHASHAAGAPRAVLREATPVRMDVSHSAWSDIFFLAMDDPDGARVLNVSVDLAVRGRDEAPRPPVETFLSVLDEPVLRLCSVDLQQSVDLRTVRDVFDFGADHLGLLRAAVVASGLVPPGLEGRESSLAPLLARVVGPGRGLLLTSCVHGIPKGSRLAVSTTLLASLVALVMRATGQTRALVGALAEDERRLVVARALFGEWLGGSGGGWQDSGGLWPGLKLIAGVCAGPEDPEHGISRGRLLPSHRRLDADDLHPELLPRLQASLVLAHGGMAQDVGPVLEMVTERYLLRSAREWTARRDARARFDDILAALRTGDVRALARATHRTFLESIRTIVPWTSNAFTEDVLAALHGRFGADFWGFLMLGGMSGGGMGFLFDPRRRDEAEDVVAEVLLAARRALSHALPFAMDPVLYRWEVDEIGTRAALVTSDAVPRASHAVADPADDGDDLSALLADGGFDAARHEEVRAALRAGSIGLAHNRLPLTTRVEDVRPGDVVDGLGPLDPEHVARGRRALAEGRLAVVTLAGGAGTRWTEGAGVVKALCPFVRMGGAHRSFLELHLRATLLAGERAGTPVPHVVTSGPHTERALAEALAARDDGGRVRQSRGRAVGLRFVPTERDLRFSFRATARQQLDEQAQKVARSAEDALCAWARRQGEASDYTDNAALRCVHPVGHFHEVPNLLRSGVLRALLAERPGLTTLMLHNVDTVGVHADAGLFGAHLHGGASLTFEVTPRRIEDDGGGLARIDGRLRLVEGFTLPRDDDALGLSYTNTLTTWIEIDGLLALFGLERGQLADTAAVTSAVRRVARTLPTYVACKSVTRRWGRGHRDVLPTLQWEQLWGDVSGLPGIAVAYLSVPRERGQQLKEPAALDGWWRDGSAASIAGRLGWSLG